MLSLAGGLLCIQLTLGILGMGASVQIDIKPQTYRGIDTKSVNVTCSPGDNGNLIRDIVLIEMFKDSDKPMVLMRQNSHISLGVNTSGNFQAAGLIAAANVSQSYLRVTFPQPSSSDSGEYTCVLYYLDANGVLQEGRASGNLTVEGLNEVLDQLMAKVSKLESLSGVIDRITQLETCCRDTSQQVNNVYQTVTSLVGRVSALEKEMSNFSQTNEVLRQNVSGCMYRVSEFEQDIAQSKLGQQRADTAMLDRVLALEEQNRNYSRQLNTLEAKETLTLAQLAALKDDQLKQRQDLAALNQTQTGMDPIVFSATSRGQAPILVGKAIPFNDVILAQGQGYDSTSGTFTAPRSGTYAFHLVLAIDRRCQGCDVRVEMLKNGQVTLTTLNLVGSQTYTDRASAVSPQASVSVAVHLNAGDKVFNYVIAATHGTRVTLDTHSLRSNVFTGYLLTQP